MGPRHHSDVSAAGRIGRCMTGAGRKTGLFADDWQRCAPTAIVLVQTEGDLEAWLTIKRNKPFS